MTAHRRRFRIAASMLVVASSGACGPVLIPGIDANDPVGASQAVLAHVPPITEFDSVAGDRQYIRHTATDSILGTILPHHKAHAHGLKDGKMLGLIDVSADYDTLGLKAGLNYWVLAVRPPAFNVPQGADPEFVNVFVPAAGGPATIRPLFINQHSYTHGQATARWRVHSDAMPWASCGAHMCCCGGSECDAM